MATASGVRAGAAYIELSLLDNVSKGLNAASQRLRSFGAGVATAGAAIAGIGAAITAPFMAGAKIFADTGSEIYDMSKRLGVGAEALSTFRYAAQRTGSDLGAVEIGFRKMQRTITAAGDGSEAAAKTLAHLGLSFRTLSGLAPEEQFRMIASRIAAIQDPTEKVSAAVDMFGRSGSNLIPMIDDLSALEDEAQSLGSVMSGESAKAAKDLSNAWFRLGKGVNGVMSALGQSVAPILTATANKIATVLASVKSWVKENKALFQTIYSVGVALTITGTAIAAVGGAIIGLGYALLGVNALIAAGVTAYGAMAAVLGALVSPLGAVLVAVGALGAYLAYTAGVGTKAVAWLSDAFGTLSDDVTAAFGLISAAISAGDITGAVKVLWATINMEFQRGKAAILPVWYDVTAAVADAFDSIYTASAQVWSAMVAGAIQAGNAIYAAVAGVANGIAQAFWTAVQGIIDAWAWMIKKILTAGYELHLIDDSQIRDLDLALKDLQGMGQALTDNQKKGAKQFYGPEIAAAQAESATVEENYQKDFAKLEAERQARSNARTQKQVSDIRTAEEDLAKARDAWKEAGKEVNEKTIAAGQEKVAKGKAREEEQKNRSIDAALNSFFDDVESGLGAAPDKMEAAGTFSAAALGQMGFGGVGDQIASSSVSTAKNTKIIADKMTKFELAFAE